MALAALRSDTVSSETTRPQSATCVMTVLSYSRPQGHVLVCLMPQIWVCTAQRPARNIGVELPCIRHKVVGANQPDRVGAVRTHRQGSYRRWIQRCCCRCRSIGVVCKSGLRISKCQFGFSGRWRCRRSIGNDTSSLVSSDMADYQGDVDFKGRG